MMAEKAFTCPLWALGIYAVLIKQALSFQHYWLKARRRSKPLAYILWSMVKSTWGLFYPGAQGSAAFSLYWSMRAVDDRVDQDKSLPKNVTISEYLNHMDTLVASLDSGGSSRIACYWEGILLIHFVRVVTEVYHLDLTGDIASMWKEFLLDARRQISKEVFPTPETQVLSGSGNIRILSFWYMILGIEPSEAVSKALVEEPLILAVDTLYDLIEDINKGIVNIPRDALEAWGINPDDLMSCHAWEDIRGFPQILWWYRRTALEASADWQGIRQSMVDVVSKVQSLPLRGMTNLLIRKVDHATHTCCHRFD